MTSHSKTELPTRPQEIPGMSLSVCICLNCLPSRRAALEVPPGEDVLLRGREAMVCGEWARGLPFLYFSDSDELLRSSDHRVSQTVPHARRRSDCRMVPRSDRRSDEWLKVDDLLLKNGGRWIL